MVKRCLILLTILWTGLGVVMAQSAVPEPSPLKVVLRAVDQLARGCRYSAEQVSSDAANPDAVETIYQTEGVVLANGDFRRMMTLQFFQSGTAVLTIHSDQISLDGTMYLTITPEGIPEGEPNPIPKGWRRYDDLLADPQLADLLHLFNQRRFVELMQIPGWILSVEEAPMEMLDGQQMRVFDLKVDGEEWYFGEVFATTQERLSFMTEYADVLAAGTISLTYRLWIGAEDGHLYRAAPEAIVDMPFSLHSSYFSDTHSISTGMLTFSDHGKVTAFPIPDDPIFADAVQVEQ